MGKVKVTLSLDERLVRRVKSRLALEGKTLSGAVESFLASLDYMGFLNSLAEALDLEREVYSYNDIVAGRPEGFDAEAVVRAMRDEREKNISRHQRSG